MSAACGALSVRSVARERMSRLAVRHISPPARYCGNASTHNMLSHNDFGSLGIQFSCPLKRFGRTFHLP